VTSLQLKSKKERNSHVPSSSQIITTNSKIIVQKMRILSSVNDKNNKIINQLDLADGLKDLLINHDLSLESFSVHPLLT
jgi:hypothetical protein